MQRFADLGRSAVIAFAVTTLFVFCLWGIYQLADDEWDPTPYAGRDYSCGPTTSDPDPPPAQRLPGTINGNPVYAITGPQLDPGYDRTLLQVRVGDRYRLCGLIGGP